MSRLQGERLVTLTGKLTDRIAVFTQEEGLTIGEITQVVLLVARAMGTIAGGYTEEQLNQKTDS